MEKSKAITTRRFTPVTIFGNKALLMRLVYQRRRAKFLQSESVNR